MQQRWFTVQALRAPCHSQADGVAVFQAGLRKGCNGDIGDQITEILHDQSDSTRGHPLLNLHRRPRELLYGGKLCRGSQLAKGPLPGGQQPGDSGGVQIGHDPLQAADLRDGEILRRNGDGPVVRHERDAAVFHADRDPRYIGRIGPASDRGDKYGSGGPEGKCGIQAAAGPVYLMAGEPDMRRIDVQQGTGLLNAAGPLCGTGITTSVIGEQDHICAAHRTHSLVTEIFQSGP